MKYKNIINHALSFAYTYNVFCYNAMATQTKDNNNNKTEIKRKSELQHEQEMNERRNEIVKELLYITHVSHCVLCTTMFKFKVMRFKWTHWETRSERRKKTQIFFFFLLFLFTWDVKVRFVFSLLWLPMSSFLRLAHCHPYWSESASVSFFHWP